MKLFYIDENLKDAESFKQRQSELGEYEVVCFTDIHAMNQHIRKEKDYPDMILLDMFSKKSGQSEKEYLQIKAETNIEQELIAFSTQREKMFNLCKKVWRPKGIENFRNLRNNQSFDNIPIAVSSRYGRRLLDSPTYNDLQKEGLYWVWKCKEDNESNGNNENKTSRDIAIDEAQSIQKIFSANQNRQNSFSETKLLDERIQHLETINFWLMSALSVVCIIALANLFSYQINYFLTKYKDNIDYVIGFVGIVIGILGTKIPMWFIRLCNYIKTNLFIK